MSERDEPRIDELDELDEPAEPYRTEQFAFVDEDPGAEGSGWLSFMNSRASRRVDRRERLRDRAALAGGLLVVLALLGALVLWSPWSSAQQADTGAEFLGGERVALLLQVQAVDESAQATAILLHDRKDADRNILVVVPADLVLPVEGEGRLTVQAALAEAGPTLSREALGELLGVPLAGTWLLTTTEFAALVDRLGGIPIRTGIAGGPARDSGPPLDECPDDTDCAPPRIVTGGTVALQVLANLVPGAQASALQGFVESVPMGYTATRDLLLDFGVLASPGLSVERLAAVLAGMARDPDPGGFEVRTLPRDPVSGGLDFAAAAETVRALGGMPGQGRSDTTPRILVSLTPGSGRAESDARADVLNAGYEYVAGPAAGSDAPTSVTVRAALPDAQAVGEAVAAALNLPGSTVRLSDDVPLVADVAVVIGPAAR